MAIGNVEFIHECCTQHCAWEQMKRKKKASEAEKIWKV